MRKLFTWVMAAALTACGGKVFVDTPAGSGTTGDTTTGNGGFGGVGSSGSNGGNGGVGAVFDGAGGGACVGSCAQVLFNGGFPCAGPAVMAYQGVQECACSSCTDSCGSSVCQTLPGTNGCLSCIKTVCGNQLLTCESN